MTKTETPEHFQEEISTVAAAEKYSLTPSYVARLARTQIIRARKFGRDWIVDEQALRDYLAQPRKTGPKPQKSQGQTKPVATLTDSNIEEEQHATKDKGNTSEQPIP